MANSEDLVHFVQFIHSFSAYHTFLDLEHLVCLFELIRMCDIKDFFFQKVVGVFKQHKVLSCEFTWIWEIFTHK